MGSELKESLLRGKGIFEVIRFIFVGGLATFVDLCVSAALFFFFPDIAENLVTTAAFLTAFSVSFFGHSKISFRKKGRLSRFLMLSVSGLALRNVLVFIMVQCGLSGLLPVLLAALAVTALTFVLSRRFVFTGSDF